MYVGALNTKDENSAPLSTRRFPKAKPKQKTKDKYLESVEKLMAQNKLETAKLKEHLDAVKESEAF